MAKDTMKTKKGKAEAEAAAAGPLPPPRLRDQYRQQVAKGLGEKFGLTNPMQHPKLEAIVQELGMTARVRFLGPMNGEAKWALIRSAAVFVLPSYSENFGIAVLEAMACSRPVVVTPEVGLAKVVEAAGAGLVVEGEPAKLAHAISSLLSDTGQRSQMGEAGRTLATARFSWDAIAGEMETVYRDCVRKVAC